jgi:Zn-dependent protease with chaperone function
MTPKSLETNLSKSIEAQLDVGFNFCRTKNDGGFALQKLADKLSQDVDTRFPVKIGIIDTAMPNAFAMPAGKVYLTSGLIKEADNSNEIAAVMAHEIAHVENRDVLVSLYRVMGFGIILDAAVGGGTGVGQQIIMLGANLTDLKNSRFTEAQADRRGMELLEKSNIDSTGMASFFAKLKKYEDKFGILKGNEFLSSHPDSGKRMQYSSQMAKTGNNAMTETEFQAVKNLCN